MSWLKEAHTLNKPMDYVGTEWMQLFKSTQRFQWKDSVAAICPWRVRGNRGGQVRNNSSGRNRAWELAVRLSEASEDGRETLEGKIKRLLSFIRSGEFPTDGNWMVPLTEGDIQEGEGGMDYWDWDNGGVFQVVMSYKCWAMWLWDSAERLRGSWHR